MTDIPEPSATPVDIDGKSTIVTTPNTDSLNNTLNPSPPLTNNIQKIEPVGIVSSQTSSNNADSPSLIADIWDWANENIPFAILPLIVILISAFYFPEIAIRIVQSNELWFVSLTLSHTVANQIDNLYKSVRSDGLKVVRDIMRYSSYLMLIPWFIQFLYPEKSNLNTFILQICVFIVSLVLSLTAQVLIHQIKKPRR